MGVDKVLHTASNHINTNKTDAQNSPTMLSKIRSRVGLGRERGGDSNIVKLCVNLQGQILFGNRHPNEMLLIQGECNDGEGWRLPRYPAPVPILTQSAMSKTPHQPNQHRVPGITSKCAGA